jgi:hypothetical protein
MNWQLKPSVSDVSAVTMCMYITVKLSVHLFKLICMPHFFMKIYFIQISYKQCGERCSSSMQLRVISAP